MHLPHLAALGATLLVSGTGNAAPRPAATGRMTAQVRFANQLNGTRSWTLSSNGNVLFSGITPGTTTGYIRITDTLSVLALRRDGSDSALATTTYPFVAQSYYTVTATYGNGERPLLAIIRDVPPKDTMP